MSSVIKSLSVKSKTQSRTRMTRSSRETEDPLKRQDMYNDYSAIIGNQPEESPFIGSYVTISDNVAEREMNDLWNYQLFHGDQKFDEDEVMTEIIKETGKKPEEKCVENILDLSPKEEYDLMQPYIFSKGGDDMAIHESRPANEEQFVTPKHEVDCSQQGQIAINLSGISDNEMDETSSELLAIPEHILKDHPCLQNFHAKREVSAETLIAEVYSKISQCSACPRSMSKTNNELEQLKNLNEVLRKEKQNMTKRNKNLKIELTRTKKLLNTELQKKQIETMHNKKEEEELRSLEQNLENSIENIRNETKKLKEEMGPCN
ncbi:hypothetical protein CDAR_564042 [Caerostris darwini]|uniref:Uncharacterized protein n=1 Tax=Caerostris darwini TaxID=1538125 RepID=A0AAV4M6W3_9ARAC|nr:hypothetical protein CDAR_564042 [Caerostris darwini]